MRRVQIGDYDFNDFEIIAIDGSPKGFTSSKIFPGSPKRIECRAAQCRLESADIRYLLTGSDPTSTNGMLIQAGEPFDILGEQNVRQFRAVKAGDNNGKVTVHYGW